MNKILITFFVFFLPCYLVAQDSIDTGFIQKIKNEEATSSEIENIAHELIDVCGSRLMNSDGFKRALVYTTRMCKKWGLSNAGPEAFGEYGRGWNNVRNYIALKYPYSQPIIGYAVPWTRSTNGLIAAPIFLLGGYDSSHIEKARDSIRGKFIMLNRDVAFPSPFEADAKRYKKEELDTLPDQYLFPKEKLPEVMEQLNHSYRMKKYLQQKGAAGYIIPGWGNYGTVFVQGALSFNKNYDSTLTTVAIALEDYMKLKRFVTRGDKAEVEMDIKNTWNTDDLTGYNFIAEIPGTDPKLKSQVVMIGAHLDSWHGGTGASDNGAGCVVMLEVMRILKALHVQPRRTIRIALWGAEEQGPPSISGSEAYVKNHQKDHRNISVYFNLDNGTGKIRGVYAQSNAKAAAIFRQWLQPFNSIDATGVTLSSTGSTDHEWFDEAGIPAFQFIQDPLDYETRTHHSNMDVYDHLSIEDLKQSAVVVAAFVYNAAMRDEMIPRKNVKP